MFVTHQYVQETLCLLHRLLEVAILSFLCHKHQVLFGSLIVVVMLKSAIDSLATLDLVANLLFVVVLACVSEHFTTGVGILRNDVLREVKTFQRTHTAECYVELSCCKHASTQVKRKLVKGHALALVYRYRPCQLQRVLGEGSCQFLLHLTLFLVVVVAVRFP